MGEEEAPAAFAAAAAPLLQPAAQLAADGDAEAAWAAFCDGSMRAAFQVLGTRPPPRPRDRGLSQATLQLIADKAAAWRALQQSSLSAEELAVKRRELRRVQRELCVAVDRDKQQELARRAERAARYWQLGQLSAFYKQTRAMDVEARRRPPGFPDGLRAADGAMLLTPEEQVKEATARFAQLFEQQQQSDGLSPELEAALERLMQEVGRLGEPASPMAPTARDRLAAPATL